MNNKDKSLRVSVNGEVRQLPSGATIAVLLDVLALGERKLAVEVNREIVPKSRHAQFVLSADDRVEIIHAVGGG